MNFRLRILNSFLKAVVKRSVSRAQNPVELRKRYERTASRVFHAPPFSLVLQRKVGGIDALWIENRQTGVKRLDGKVILYFHGGGYVAGSPATHAAMLGAIAKMTGLAICAVDYRLAPEHPFPESLEDCRKAYDALLAKGYGPEDIIIGGDSAGGGLTLSVLAELGAEDIAPAGAFVFSPSADLTFSGESFEANRRTEYMLPTGQKQIIRERYLGPNPREEDTPRHSPIFAEFQNAPPVFVQYSNSEILRDDARRAADRLEEFGADVTRDAWNDMPHVWVMFHEFLPEARQALGNLADWITQQPGFSAGQGER